jgi:hypothetical protein
VLHSGFWPIRPTDGIRLQRFYDEKLTQLDCEFLAGLGIQNSMQSPIAEGPPTPLWFGISILLSGLIFLGFWIRYLVGMW